MRKIACSYLFLFCYLTICAPNGISDSCASLKNCFPNGIPMIVMHQRQPMIRFATAISKPKKMIQITFTKRENMPLPYTISLPNGTLTKSPARMLSSSVIYESSNRELLKRTLQYVYCCFTCLSVFVAMVCDSSKHLSVVVTLLKPYHLISSGYSIFGSIMECHFIISS